MILFGKKSDSFERGGQESDRDTLFSTSPLTGSRLEKGQKEKWIFVNLHENSENKSGID